jgi:hypothetical protein
MCETLTMCDSRYPPTVLWAAYSRNDAHTCTERIAVHVLIESREEGRPDCIVNQEAPDKMHLD